MNDDRPITSDAGLPEHTGAHTARLVLLTFLLTFMCARLLVFLIMSRSIPDLYVHVGGTHMHHLNFGIFLLSVAGAWLLFRRPAGRELSVAAAVYGAGLALTFDEFGMWLHLNSDYWQRESFDAVVVVAALLGMIAFAPAIRKFRPRHWAGAAALAVVLAVFVYGLVVTSRYAGRRIGPALQRLEQKSPP